MSKPPPPVVPRKPSGVRVMMIPGEQPRPSALPIYTDFNKGKMICLKCFHVCYSMCMCTVAMKMYFPSFVLWLTADLLQQACCFCADVWVCITGLFSPPFRKRCQCEVEPYISTECSEGSGMCLHASFRFYFLFLSANGLTIQLTNKQ